MWELKRLFNISNFIQGWEETIHKHNLLFFMETPSTIVAWDFDQDNKKRLSVNTDDQIFTAGEKLIIKSINKISEYNFNLDIHQYIQIKDDEDLKYRGFLMGKFLLYESVKEKQQILFTTEYTKIAGWDSSIYVVMIDTKQELVVLSNLLRNKLWLLDLNTGTITWEFNWGHDHPGRNAFHIVGNQLVFWNKPFSLIWLDIATGKVSGSVNLPQYIVYDENLNFCYSVSLKSLIKVSLSEKKVIDECLRWPKNTKDLKYEITPTWKNSCLQDYLFLSNDRGGVFSVLNLRTWQIVIQLDLEKHGEVSTRIRNLNTPVVNLNNLFISDSNKRVWHFVR